MLGRPENREPAAKERIFIRQQEDAITKLVDKTEYDWSKLIWFGDARSKGVRGRRVRCSQRRRDFFQHHGVNLYKLCTRHRRRPAHMVRAGKPCSTCARSASPLKQRANCASANWFFLVESRLTVSAGKAQPNGSSRIQKLRFTSACSHGKDDPLRIQQKRSDASLGYCRPIQYRTLSARTANTAE